MDSLDKSGTKPIIQNLKNLPFSVEEENILESMFSGYERLVVKEEFGEGLSGGRVFLVRPITQNGAELPAVIKLDRKYIIQKEWNTFLRFVHQKVPKVAQIDGPPVYSGNDRWGGIRYPLVGDGRFYTKSLGSFCQYASIDDVVYVLEQQLFPSIGVLWQDNRVAHERFLGGTFDSVLPVNLVITYTSVADHALPLSPQTIHQQHYDLNTEVSLSDFVVTEVNQTGELTIDLPNAGKDLPHIFRIRITNIPNIKEYQEGQRLSRPVTGIIQGTRDNYLKTQISHIFNNALDLASDKLVFPGIGLLPNPLNILPHILTQTEDLRVGIIHGDLNLENILVEYDQRSRSIHLIDFANSRFDYILHDLFRLETNFWLHLVSKELTRYNRTLNDLLPLINDLHNSKRSNSIPEMEKSFHIIMAIRRVAKHFLINPQSWKEYYQGLIVHLLGALKFKNLDTLPNAPLPKQTAFVVSALIQQLYQEISMPQDIKNRPHSSQAVRQNALSKILSIAAQRSAQLLMYGSCLGAIALIPENSIPATLVGLATGIGVNSLASLIERVAHNQTISDVEISNELETAVIESNFEQIIVGNRTILSEIRRLTFWQEQIKLFIQSDNERVIELLVNYDTSIVNLRSEFEALRADIKKLQNVLSRKPTGATKKLAESSSDVVINTGVLQSDHIVITGEKSASSGLTNPGKTTITTGDIKSSNLDITGKIALDREI